VCNLKHGQKLYNVGGNVKVMTECNGTERHDDKGNDDYTYYIIYLLKYLMSESQNTNKH